MTSGSHESGHEADALVSVVVAARNAAGTVEETLASLSAQSWPAWEAVVVDDGSTDATAAIVTRLAAAEGRIRLVPEGGGGVGASRSIGVEASRGEALLFLDADDWLLPDALRLLIAPLLEDTSLDGAYCGWKRVGEGGATISEWRPETEPELFPAFARYCPFAVHCCLLRRAAFERHGGFDPGLATCEDWDLWQRLTRSGARLAAVHETLAVYRTRPGSMSLADGRFIVDGLEVINRGHAPDPRVPHPHAAYRNGVDPALAPNARLQIALWGAGLAIGQGRDAAELLELVADELAPTFSPGLAADTLYWAVPVGAAQPYTAWPELWNMHEERLGEALRELEGRTGAPRLAARIRALLESRILTAASGTGLRVGRMERRSIELTEPIHDLVSPSSRVLCEATVEGEPLGLVELPVCDGRIPSRVLADTLAASLGWLLLGRFLERQGHSGPDGATDGWHGFLRLLWGRDEWPLSRFYPQGQVVRHCTEGTRTSPVELSEDVRSLPLDGPAEIPLTLAGRFLGLLCVDGPVDLAADSLVATVTEAAGFDLCIVAVREALIGRSLDDPTPLRQRLREAAATTDPRERLPRALRLGRRDPLLFGTSAGRLATLPSAAAVELRRSAREHGEELAGARFRPRTVHYAADALPSARRLPAPAQPVEPRLVQDGGHAEVPILMYHRVSRDPRGLPARYCVHPDLFEAQLRQLRDLGYRSLELGEWRIARSRKRPLAERPVVLTFDDGYADFAEEAWPLLREYGFGATLFVVADAVGGSNDWDRRLGPPLPLLDWDSLRRLRSQGLTIGSHSATHAPLTGLSNDEVAIEAASARAAIRRNLGEAVSAFAYPYGDVNPSVETLVGACGYTFGLTCRSARATFGDGLLDLPRLDVDGEAGLEGFLRLLEPASTKERARPSRAAGW